MIGEGRILKKSMVQKSMNQQVNSSRTDILGVQNLLIWLALEIKDLHAGYGETEILKCIAMIVELSRNRHYKSKTEWSC